MTTPILAPGLYLAHKPVGATSRSVVEALRGTSRLSMCHGGALDPFAEGLLLILVGEATKLFEFLHAVPKVYEAEVVWGSETDTLDPLGQVIATGDTAGLNESRLDDEMKVLTGWQEQVPPATSNKRVGGERAYVRAHRGEAVELPPSRVFLHEAAWVRHELPWRSWMRVSVGGGYYVRSLARDLGRTLGSTAHLAALKRVSIGPWTDPAPETPMARLQGEALLPWCLTRRLRDEERQLIESGSPVPRGDVRPAPWRLPEGFPAPLVRLLHQGRIVGIAPDGEQLVPAMRLRGV